MGWLVFVMESEWHPQPRREWMSRGHMLPCPILGQGPERPTSEPPRIHTEGEEGDGRWGSHALQYVLYTRRRRTPQATLYNIGGCVRTIQNEPRERLRTLKILELLRRMPD